MSRVRVVVVDDSPTMRGVITRVLSQDPEIEVVGTADDPLQARAAIKELNPDVITLDELHQKCADVGHDTEKVKAKDEVYNNLHACCQYDREGKK